MAIFYWILTFISIRVLIHIFPPESFLIFICQVVSKRAGYKPELAQN